MTSLRRYGSGLALVGRTLVVELFGKKLSLSAPAPTNGQVLTFDELSQTWSPADAGGAAGGLLPSGTNGALLAFAGGLWSATSVGSSGQVLVSNGSFAPSWAASVSPLIHVALSSSANSVQTSATLVHEFDGGAGAVGIGARLEYRVTNNGGDRATLATIDAVATDVSADQEHGVVDVRVASAGTLTRSTRIYRWGIHTGITAGTTALPSDAALGFGWASRSIVVRDSGDISWLDVWRIDGSNRWVFGSSDNTNSGGVVLLAPSSSADIVLRRGSTDHLLVNSIGALFMGTTMHATTLRGSTLTIGLTSVVAVYQGGARVPEATVSASTPLDASHEVVFVDSTAGAVTLTLPAGAAGRVIAIQRVAGANNVVVQRAGSPDTIRAAGASGLTSWTLSDDSRHSLIFRSSNNEWVAEA